MKTIVFYGRRQVGMVVLVHLVALGYKVKVIAEDELVDLAATLFNLERVTIDTMGEFDLFVCCHGAKIIPEQYLVEGKFINIHPCLFKYKGSNPIKRYIENKDTKGSVGCHYMVKEVDAGEVIYEEFFDTPEIKDYGEFFNIAIPHYMNVIHIALKKVFRRPTAAIVRIYMNTTMLRLWLSYYRKYFDHLYVVACNTPAGHFEELQKEIPFNLVQMESCEIYSEQAHFRVFQLQKDLLTDHDWVLYADADEFVFPDTEKYTDLRDFMDKCNEEIVFCKGYEVIQSNDEGLIDYSIPYLSQRKYWVKDTNGSYCKPLLTRIPADWELGFHNIQGMKPENPKDREDSGLFLIHLKHANPSGPKDWDIYGTGTHEIFNGNSENKELIPEKVRRLF